MTFSFMKLCLPAKIYLALLIISILLAVYQGIQFSWIFFKTVFGLIWMWILNWLCSKGQSTLSWILLFLPYVFILIVMVTTAEVLNVLQYGAAVEVEEEQENPNWRL